MSTQTLLDAIWGREHAVGPEVVRVTMHRLQHKLNEAGACNLVDKVHGVGFVVRTDHD